MKTTNKKMVGMLLIGLVLMSIGAIFATAQTDETTQEPTMPPIPFGRHYRLGPLRYNLTQEEQTEIEDFISTLREQNATNEKIQTAIQDKLDEFGVLDEQLDNEITQTEQRLQILYRQQELREQGYSWDEISTIIQEEFNLEDTMEPGFGMAFDHGFGPGPKDRCIPPELSSGEEIQQ